MFHIKARAPRRVLALGLPTFWGATAVTYKLTCPLAQQDGLGPRIVTSAVFFAVGTGLVLHVRRTLLRELRRARQAAGAAQQVLLRPPAPRIGGLDVAAAQLSADRGAQVGGDLYDVARTEHGVRVVMGDARGHGLAALGTAAAVLGSFREAVHDEPALDGVLRRLDRTLARHLRDGPGGTAAEEFVTVLLLEIRPDGTLHALNCGHPWPHLIRGTEVDPVARDDPLPPLGVLPLPAELPAAPCGRLRPGELLVLHTDGVEDARDPHGRFFPLREVLADAAQAEPGTARAVLGRAFAMLLHHARGAPADDVALLVLGCEHQPGGAGNRAAGRGAPAAGTRPLVNGA
ncbi:PP2C family protein-serine/threonine phosphatase [Streptomyces poriticola]|uniref:PP2C family protein-serine/threonine phosphatase n=1 Tax=Streptomyces poriticola TaxID=3120506 RepID=UPI002FCDF083